jgi:hypothetical protein
MTPPAVSAPLAFVAALLQPRASLHLESLAPRGITSRSLDTPSVTHEIARVIARSGRDSPASGEVLWGVSSRCSFGITWNYEHITRPRSIPCPSAPHTRAGPTLGSGLRGGEASVESQDVFPEIWI